MGYYSTGFSTERMDTGRNNKFYGKYRAKVTNNNDKKDKMGRIKVKCPAVLGNSESQWCNPCFPIGIVSMPKVGDTVWVEFEGGDPNKPIWVGMWFGLQEIPSEIYKKVGYHHVIKLPAGEIHFNDQNKSITVQANGNLYLKGKEIHEN